MADEPETKSIRVHVMGREYALRVQKEDETFTRKVASFVNERMEQFRDEHPKQAELTTAVITALALAEELHTQKGARANDAEALNDELDRLSDRLETALDAPPASSDST